MKQEAFVLGEWDGVTLGYVSQCSVCKNCKGKGCSAFNTEQRKSKYYDRNDKDFCKCSEFELDKDSPQSELFLKLSKDYSWKKVVA